MGKLCECKQKTHAKVTFECIVLDLHIQCKQCISVVNYITFSLLYVQLLLNSFTATNITKPCAFTDLEYTVAPEAQLVGGSKRFK